MLSFIPLVSYSLLLIPSLPRAAVALPHNCPDRLCLSTRADVPSEQYQRELGELVSSDASIYGPDDDGFADLTSRFQAYMPPQPQLVVQAGSEEDVATVISYADRNSVPFYVTNRRHGLPISQGAFSGIQIDMTQLMEITISDDETYALFQGGTYDQQVIDYLWERGFVATTGSCACVGMLGPGLGGGHGRFQGFYGLISDNMLKLNVVLGNGTAITVSDTEHSDLFWGMQGAGHNFAAVTSFELRIYPREAETWYYKNYVFTNDKLEDLFEQLNVVDANGTMPAELMNVGFYLMDQDFSSEEPLISWSFQYAGPQSEAQQYLTPFDDLDPVSVSDGNVPYPEILPATNTGMDDPICDHGTKRAVGTAGTQVYNITTQRQLMDLYKQKVAEYPNLAGSYIVMEAYSVGGVIEKDPDASAFPLRDDYLLLQISVNWASDESLDVPAREWVDETVDLWNQGQPSRRPSTYVNYGLGTESLESTYGYEPWRLERLLDLKEKYDPGNKFRYYVPLVQEE